MWPTEEEPGFGSFVHDQVEDLRRLGVEVRVFHFDGRADARAYARAASGVRSLVNEERFDLLHAHYGLTGAVALSQRRLPVITTFHGSDTGYVRWQRYVSWVVARATSPLFVSREAARRLGRPSAPVIPVGVDTELFRPRERREARRELGWSPGSRFVLFPGSRSNARKRFDLFSAALREAERSIPGLRAVSLEHVSRAGVALLMNAVDVTMMTSDWEGSPVAVRESLACQTPVVSVDVGDVAEVLSGLPGCAVVPRSPLLLAQAVVAALDASRPAELRRRADLTSRQRTAERLVALYSEVARR